MRELVVYMARRVAGAEAEELALEVLAGSNRISRPIILGGKLS